MSNRRPEKGIIFCEGRQNRGEGLAEDRYGNRVSNAEFQRLLDLGYFANTNAGEQRRNKGKVVINLTREEPKKHESRKRVLGS